MVIADYRKHRTIHHRSSLLTALLIALFPSLILTFTNLVKLNKINIEIVSRVPDRYIWYEDLQNDNTKERFLIGNDIEGNLFLTYEDDKNNIIGRKNYRYSMVNTRELTEPISEDVDNDGVKDIILFAQQDDSLFLNIFSYQKKISLVEDRYITKIGGINNKLDFIINWIGSYEVANNEEYHLFFSVAGAFAQYPRRVFRYDYKHDSLISSINTGSGSLDGLIDLESNSISIYISGEAYGNTSTDYCYPYLDTCCWFFAFNENLTLKNEPIPIGDHPSNISSALVDDGFVYLLYCGNKGDSAVSSIIKIDLSGRIKEEKILKNVINPEFYTLWINGNNTYYFFDKYYNSVYEFDPENFGLKSNNFINRLEHKRPLLQDDLDHDGRLEFILQDVRDNSICIYSESLREINYIPFDTNAEELVTYGQGENNNLGELIIATRNGCAMFSLEYNRYYKLRYLLWLGIYLFNGLIIYTALLFQRAKIEKEQKLQNMISALQLKNLGNQLDPHFTFNALNSVGNAIYKESKETAYDLFQRFTRMIRSSLIVSDRIFRSLNEEIKFTEDYLVFQKTRFIELFDYSFIIPEEINISEINIPKMLIQGFAENAVKHAFHGIDYKGIIVISLEVLNGEMLIRIDDNGIGINRSKKESLTSGTRKGELILYEQIEQINKLYKSGISIKSIDKSDNSLKDRGTTVLISMPLKVNTDPD